MQLDQSKYFAPRETQAKNFLDSISSVSRPKQPISRYRNEFDTHTIFLHFAIDFDASPQEPSPSLVIVVQSASLILRKPPPFPMVVDEGNVLLSEKLSPWFYLIPDLGIPHPKQVSRSLRIGFDTHTIITLCIRFGPKSRPKSPRAVPVLHGRGQSASLIFRYPPPSFM